MPPLNATSLKASNFVQREPEPVKRQLEQDEESEFVKRFTYFHLRRPLKTDPHVRYFYVDQSKYGLVWVNVFMFTILHIYYFYGLYHVLTTMPFKTWFFGFFYMHFAGLGVTMGAHRLWAHKAYSARLPLRILLCLLFTIAGQNDLMTWVRDHRVHHKFTETDADPHNSKRGMFFAHVGWLLTRKHPDVLIKGQGVPLNDLQQDKVVMLSRRYYVVLYLFFRFFIPIFVPMYFWDESFSNALISMFAQYIGMLHSTWFVNSAAHLFGDRPYNKKIQPRNNFHVNMVSMGEGYHNFHHAFPFDYAIDEHGSKLNLGYHLITFFSKIGLAYKLKRASPELIKATKQRVKAEQSIKEDDHYLNPHPYC